MQALKSDLVAQLVEHLPFKERVLGSSPSQVTKIRPGAGTGRQAWLRAMCPLGRAGSTPALGTHNEKLFHIYLGILNYVNSISFPIQISNPVIHI